jgi:hypothetical protein
MHKVRGNYSSCTGKNIYSSSGGAQEKKRKLGVKIGRYIYIYIYRIIEPGVLDTTKEPPNIDTYTVFHTHTRKWLLSKMEKKSRTGKGEEEENEGSDAKASLAGGKQQQQQL